MSLFYSLLILSLSFLVNCEYQTECITRKGKTECVLKGIVEMPNVTQGDMVHDDQPQMGRNALREKTRLWPNATIPVVFHQDFVHEERQRIEAAMLSIMKETCIKFVPWTGQGPVAAITKGPYCYASVGFDLDPQGLAHVNLESPGCYFPEGLIQHELLHLIGLFHEQSRPDRDEYVTIVWDNIQKEPDMRSNFVSYTEQEVTTFGLPYNYQSVMHYVNNEFSIDPNLPTLLHKFDPSVKLGQRDFATHWDFEKVRRMYGCPDESFMDFEK